MGNFKWGRKNEFLDAPYVVVLMISRNKDNKELLGFKQRRKALFCSKDMDKINAEFNQFVREGMEGELSRLYISLNARDVNKVKKDFLHMLIDKEPYNFDNLNADLAGIAARKENALEHKWFFDFDLDDAYKVRLFKEDIIKIDPTTRPTIHYTPHGFAVVVEHGFDTRELSSWSEYATLKRDDLICTRWEVTKNNL